MGDTWTDIWMLVLISLLCSAILIMGVIAICNHVSLGAELASIEQARSAVATAHGNNAEAVLGEALAMNQRVVSYRYYNALWWSGWMVPDEWDSVKLIDIR